MAAAKKGPICVIVLGMAGSGKTSLVSRLSESEKKPYIVNLDPACLQTPYHANIDIRDSINYKETMKNYKLGPNGAIVTCLNLFATKCEEVVKVIRDCPNDICLIDTPGQIEVFTWSVSGQIITQTLAQNFPTVVLYVIDSVRSTSPTTFMSNMMYACSTMYKYLVPFIAVMNKTDIVSHLYAKEWMTDVDSFMQVLDNEDSYLNTLNGRLALTLDIFYEDLKMCGFSAQTGDGIEDLFKLIEDAKDEYEKNYKKEYEQIRLKAEEHKKMSKETEEGESDFKSLKMDQNSDVYIRHPGNESSEDSEGEEEDHDGESTEATDETYAKHLKNQKELQLKRAKEAEMRKTSKASTSKN
ncbi:GPN-loop GTPase 1 [Coccinella septempunctata]|uniref:GPN-loop GTPase 1 n=1 Tax=Coccinella septempunctata TaxID=41139 RepID=UPI001D063C3C|nr:GPN-loop GTPase 1 [Coccinella septempunctata]